MARKPWKVKQAHIEGFQEAMCDCGVCGERYFRSMPEQSIVQCPRCEAVANRTSNRIQPATDEQDPSETKRKCTNHMKRK